MKFYLTVILTLVISFSVFGQTPPMASATPPTQIPESDDQPIKVNTLLLNLPVIASDRAGRNISGLTKEDFSISQDGEKQPIEFFSNEDASMSVAIVVDTSGSTSPIRDHIKTAARTFLQTLRPEDKAMVVSFDGKFKVLSDLTSDQKQLNKAIGKLELIEMNGTSMYDAIDEVINNKFATVKGRKAIILLTDGMEGSLKISFQEFMRTLSESDVVIYPILFRLFEMPKKNSPQYQFLNYLQTIADITAGKIYGGGSHLQKSFQSIAEEMKRQYLIGFYPQPAKAGKPSDIRVNTSRENVVLRTKGIIRLKSPTR